MGCVCSTLQQPLLAIARNFTRRLWDQSLRLLSLGRLLRRLGLLQLGLQIGSHPIGQTLFFLTLALFLALFTPFFQAAL